MHSHVEDSGVMRYIVKRIVENKDGRIEVDSEEETVFNLRLKEFIM